MPISASGALSDNIHQTIDYNFAQDLHDSFKHLISQIIAKF